MNFSDTARAPVVITVAGEKVHVPKFTRADWKEWAAERDAARLAKATEGMDAEERFKLVAFYNVPPTTSQELRDAAIVTLEGQERIVRTCLANAKWPEDRIVAFLDDNDPVDVQLLALQLASIRPRLPQPAETTPPPTGEGEKGSDPPKTAAPAGTDLASD